jgi:uncharacterized protein (DUF1015 family)
MQIKAFNAYRYNSEVVGNAGDCIAPPYDVIDAGQQQHLYDKNPHNIVRIIQGKKDQADNESQNVYTRAADYLTQWIKSDALKQDADEAIYAYVQNFEINDTQYQRYSFIAKGKLEDFGTSVLAHEKILNNPIQDRLKLTRATGCAFGLVFLLYNDPESVADKILSKAMNTDCLVDMTDDQSVRHRLYAVTDTADIKAITDMMADKTCVVADGHHRYTTALAYRDETNDPKTKYQMLVFSNIAHEGLIVLATHRVLNNLDNFDLAGFVNSLENDFEVSEYPWDTEQQKNDCLKQMAEKMKKEFDNKKNAFGIYAGGSFCVAVLKNTSAMDQAAPDKSEPWKKLDVAVLHKLIIEKQLGVDEDMQAKGGYIEYVKDSGDKINRIIEDVDNKRSQLGLFVNPPRLEQIEDVAKQGDRMPQKSTYFYPKMFTGLTVDKF